MIKTCFVATVVGLALLTPPCSAQASGEPYTVEVWATVLFGIDGKPLEYTVADESKYPAKFMESVKMRLERARVPAADGAELPKTLRTGVRLDFLVTPNNQGGAEVRMNGLSIGPRPVTRYYASYPKDIGRTGGWVGEVKGICKVGVEGRCASIEVETLPGMPESVRRYARASLKGWSFDPQQVDGSPIGGEYVMRLRLNTLDNMPENFRQDKFLRILNTR
jgi:hypothetical protein